MKAVVISGPKRATVSRVADQPLNENDARVKVLAAGVCGTDVELFEGTMPYLISGSARYPLVPGHEWVGEICEVGSNVNGFKPGDRVVGECSCGCMRCERCQAGHYHRCAYRTETGILNRPGAFAEYIHFPTSFLHLVSRDVSIEAACLIEPTAVAFNGVRRAQVSPRDDVVIFGDGPIGLLLMMMTKAFGARSVAVVGTSPHRLTLAEKLGADAIIDVQEANALAMLGYAGASPSVVLEATGNPDSIAAAVNTVAPGGRIIVQGIFAGARANGLNLDRLVVDEITLQGALGSPGVWPDVIQLIEAGRIDPAPLVTDTLDLGEYHRAIDQVKRRQGIKNIIRLAA
jgi:L-iditol 2-dehydrogenase